MSISGERISVNSSYAQRALADKSVLSVVKFYSSLTGLGYKKYISGKEFL